MKAVDILKGFLVTQLNHCIIFIFAITVFGVSGGGQLYILQSALLGLLPFAFFLIRYFARSIAAFVIVHFLTVATAIFLLIIPLQGSSVPVSLFSMLITGYLLLSAVVKLVKKDKIEWQIHQLASIIIFIIMILLQRYQGIQGADRYYSITVIVYIGLYFIRIYILNFSKTILGSDRTGGITAKQAIFKSGIKLAVLFTAAVVIVISLFPQFNTPAVTLPSYSSQGEPAGSNGWPEPELPSLDLYNPTALDSSWAYAGIVFNVFFIAVISVFIIVIFIRILNWKSAVAARKNELEPDPAVDVHEKVSTIKTKSRSRGLFRYFSPRERIRRIFKKRVLAGKSMLVGDRDKGLLSRYTAHECRQAMGERIPADIYDKARYSNLECTAEDVKACRVK